MEKTTIFKRGVVLWHRDTDTCGVVIDWGIYSMWDNRYMLSDEKDANSVRVWTRGGYIEVWPWEAVKKSEQI
jgi:hypothetical protein